MATWRGNGGKVLVGASNIELGVSKWTAEETIILANKTNSKSAGHKQRQGTVKDTKLSFELPWDDTQDPNAIGIFNGAIIKVQLYKGESGKKMVADQAIIETVSYINDEDEDIVRLSVTGYSNQSFVHS